MTLEELQAWRKAVESKLKAEGFASVEEAVAAHGAAVANLAKAEAARDKFKEDNDKAREIIRSKGGEKSALLQEIEDLKKQVEELKGGSTEGAGGTKPPAQNPPAKSVEDELAEVEASLTDDQWAVADGYLAKMDDDTALKYADDKKTRLEFLRGLKNDPALKPLSRPKSFRPQAAKPGESPQPQEDAYTALQRMLGRVVPGPNGRAAPSGSTAQAKTPAASWLNG